MKYCFRNIEKYGKKILEEQTDCSMAAVFSIDIGCLPIIAEAVIG